MSGQTPANSHRVRVRDVDVVAPNFKKRLSGVTSTIVQLVPEQAKGLAISTLGPGLPDTLPKLRWWQMPGLLLKPANRRFRVWHARRNPEMLAGVVMRDVFRAPMKLVFTSASQREHTRWTRFLIRRMDRVVATSRKTAGYLQVPNRVVMHGIDTERFSPPSNTEAGVAAVGMAQGQRYVGCFGRVRRQKGTDLFVDTMIALLPERPGWSAIIAGQATQPHAAFETGLKEKVRQAGLEDRIHFVGTREDIPAWYRALSLFIAPQRWEGFGLTPLEAMATAVPVVATDVGAFSELLENSDAGTLVPVDDLLAMISAAARYMDDETLRDAAADAALAHARSHFPLEGEAQALNALYEDLWREASS
ncbi:glycosyltransferase family 4 protein [uncultured Nitratireductor sp.]|uniref:glycosyltransferase family 4 protein n=1 Tax=uncultured Nitratireductor sp. TaxID=520953 RepID=UPI0025EA000C|nr:glycosyltransferase family 4 protein [uncultured Nitratireductor sp.]